MDFTQNSAARSLGVRYSQLIHKMTENKYHDKILSDICTHDSATFEKIVQKS